MDKCFQERDLFKSGPKRSSEDRIFPSEDFFCLLGFGVIWNGDPDFQRGLKKRLLITINNRVGHSL